MISRLNQPRDQLLQPNLPDKASFKLIGLGGVGSIVARYLAIFLASLGRSARLVLIDGDLFEPSNASRMLFGNCGNKAAVIHEELLPRFADSSLSLDFIDEYVTSENIRRLVHDGDIVLLAVDNHATRKLISDHCATLDDVCLISGGNDGIEKTTEGQQRRGTFGNAQIYLRSAGSDCTPSLTRFHPEIAQPGDKNPADKNCTELITSVPQILFANLMVASTILNTVWLQLCGATHYGEVAFDIQDARMRPVLQLDNSGTTGEHSAA